MRPWELLVIGGGVNGLVHAFYQARAGHRVTLLERMPTVGGAVRTAFADVGGRRLEYPLGATLLGQMQRFVFEEMGLDRAVVSGASPHSSMYRFDGDREAFRFHADPVHLQALAARIGLDLHGLDAFERDGAKVVAFLQNGFHEGHPPTKEAAQQALGKGLTRRWMEGSAHALLDHYLRDPRLQVMMGKDVVESGPVPFTAPGTAFTIPLLDAGSVFDGKWGYVGGGLGRLMTAMERACRRAGAHVVTDARVIELDPRKGVCRSVDSGRERVRSFDHVTFATDPFTAAKLIGDLDLVAALSKKRWLGSSGKLIMLFREPVRWKDDTGEEGFDACLKFFLHQRSLDAVDAASEQVADGREDFVDGHEEIYCEGAGLRMLGQERGYDSLMVFFKHLAHGRRGEELPDIREHVRDRILRHTRNGRDALVFERLLTPMDLTDEFLFPGGNIDHAELTTGQNAWARTYAAPGAARRYQFGPHANASYCGAGAYPCGSVSGTAGYMCHRELERHLDDAS